MQSIKPQYCELIAAGRKTYEVRKTKPKIETPFKVYIYCTIGQKLNNGFGGISEALKQPLWKLRNGAVVNYLDVKTMDVFQCELLNGKVIGEYICDEITEYTTEFHPADDLFQGIWKTVFDEDTDDTYGEIVTSNDFDNPDDCDICRKSCLTFNDIKRYVGYGDKKFYAYHITNLKIYGEPKALSEFAFAKHCFNFKNVSIAQNSFGDYVAKYSENSFCRQCPYLEDGWCEKIDGQRQITRPPQSWCYVEEVSQ